MKVLDVEGAVRRVQGGWTATGQRWEYDADRYGRVASTRKAEQGAMLDYIATDRLPAAVPAAGAGRHRGAALRSLRQLRRVSRCPVRRRAARVVAAREVLQRPGVGVEPRKMWPTGMATFGSAFTGMSGKIPAGDQFSPGRAIARLDGIGWGTALRELLADGQPDGEVPVPLRYPMADVLRVAQPTSGAARSTGWSSWTRRAGRCWSRTWPPERPGCWASRCSAGWSRAPTDPPPRTTSTPRSDSAGWPTASRWRSTSRWTVAGSCSSTTAPTPAGRSRSRRVSSGGRSVECRAVHPGGRVTQPVTRMRRRRRVIHRQRNGHRA